MPVTLEKMLERFSPTQRAKIDREANRLIAESRSLAQLRKGVEMTQTALAEVLQMSQASISEIESNEDALVSTVARMVEGMGGRLRLIAELADGSQIPLRLGKAAKLTTEKGARGLSQASIVPKSLARARRPPTRRKSSAVAKKQSGG